MQLLADLLILPGKIIDRFKSRVIHHSCVSKFDNHIVRVFLRRKKISKSSREAKKTVPFNS
jgi:hypothetical protein